MPEGAAGSWGYAVIAYAERVLGIALDRWQRRVIVRALATDADGRLLHRIYLISVARQNGKTAIVRALIGWALTFADGPPWANIAGLAHERGQAMLPYKAALADLAGIARQVGRRQLALTRYLGIRSAMYDRHREYHVYSRDARDSLRGSSNDLVLFDEVRTQRDHDTWAAVEPTTTARPQPLIVPTSSAGDDRSVLLREWWERGLRIIEGAEPAAGFGMTWYAASETRPRDDPREWAEANPAVAEGRLDPEVIRSSLYSLTESGFRAERLNLWTVGGDEWLPPGLWMRQTRAQPQPGGRIVLGVEAVPNWRRATVAVAYVTDEGSWTGVAGELDVSQGASATVMPATLQKMVTDLAWQYRADAVAFSAAAAAAPYAEAGATAAGVEAIAMGPRQIRAASSLLRSELVGGRLTHQDDPLLLTQVRAARPSASIESGDWYLSIRDSVGEVDAIRAVAWASWGAIAPPERKRSSGIFI